MHWFCSSFGYCLIFKPGWAQGFDPHGRPGLRHLISSRRRLWYTGGTIQAGMNTFMWLTFHATLTPISMVLIDDLVLSSDATLRPGKAL